MGQILYLAILESKFSKFLTDFIFYHAGLHSSIISLKIYIWMFSKTLFWKISTFGVHVEPRSWPDPYIKTFWRDFRWRVFLLASFPLICFPWTSLPSASFPRLTIRSHSHGFNILTTKPFAHDKTGTMCTMTIDQ